MPSITLSYRPSQVRLRPVDYEEVTITAPNAIGLTASKAKNAWVTVIRFDGGGQARFTVHGVDPTGTVGMPILDYDDLTLTRDEAMAFKAIRDSTTTTDLVARVIYYHGYVG